MTDQSERIVSAKLRTRS